MLSAQLPRFVTVVEDSLQCRCGSTLKNEKSLKGHLNTGKHQQWKANGIHLNCRNGYHSFCNPASCTCDCHD